MRKHIVFIAGIIGGVVGDMTFQTPKDSLSTFARSLRQIFGSHAPTWIDTPITDRIVRIFAFGFAACCLCYLLIAGCFSLGNWWINRDPPYRSPFLERAKQHIKKMHGVWASKDGKIFELEAGNKIATEQSFPTPVAFRVKVKTLSTNIRFSYAEKELIFNWERSPDLLHIDGGPLHCCDKEGVGPVPKKRFVTIDLRYFLDSLAIDVNGQNIYYESADFRRINRPLEIFTAELSTIYVKSVLVGKPLPMGFSPDIERYRPEEVVYAKYGRKPQWTHKTSAGRELADHIKDLLASESTVRATTPILQVIDPVPDDYKELRLRLANGSCVLIPEYRKIKPSFAKECEQFFPEAND